MATRAPVPIYLMNKTVIGSAVLEVESGKATITIQTDSNLVELMEEHLIGFGVIIKAGSPAFKKERTDGEE